MMEDFESLEDIVFSWSLEDIFDENLYKNQIELGKSPGLLQSNLQDYFGSYRYPLLDETRAQLQSSIEIVHRAPSAKVIAIIESKPHGTKLYDCEVDYYSSSFGDEHKTMPGDLFILADAKAGCVSDLREGRSWILGIVTELFPNNKSEDHSTSVHLKVKASKEFDVEISIRKPLYFIFLGNIAPNIRIWKTMHMSTGSRWKVIFSNKFLKSFKQLMSSRTKMSILSLLLKLSSGWRSKKSNVDIICISSSMIVKRFKVEGLYIVCSNDIVKNLGYMQVLKIWDILPDLCAVQALVDRLDRIFLRYTDGFINLCSEKYFESDVEVPLCWPPSLNIIRYKNLSINSDVDESTIVESFVEDSKVNESLLLMKFYALSSGVVNHLLSDREGKELELPFEVTDEEMEAILYNRSSFIVGRSGTGKTTVLTMKLYQKEQHYNLAEEGLYDVEQSSGGSNITFLRQVFVTFSPKLCFAVKQHVLNLKSFASGGSHSAELNTLDMEDFDDEEAQFSDLPKPFLDIQSNCYPLFLTFRKFLKMLDGSLSNSYFDRFLDKLKLPRSLLQTSRSVLLKTFLRTKEVNYERFNSSYWPHFNMQLTKTLDASRVFTEIISHIKGGLEAVEASDGKRSRDSYVLMSGRASNLSEENREIVYDIFQVYEKLKMRNGEFDIADFVNDIHRRLKHERYRGDLMDFVYIDEVQDLTISQIALFKHVCSNVDEGFVFSGDTAQIISKGIDFRFQDIRHLFYKKFISESRSNEQDQMKNKPKISDLFHLTENFRTHAGILKLSQSILDLIHYFFPQSIDTLNPETSPILGENPVLLESGENENVIEKLFGKNGTSCGNIVGFGAEQVILVRDSSARNKISSFVGKQSIVLTILECKGLEFQDVLMYEFFGSSPLKNQWRLIYEYMKEHELLDPTLPLKFPRFNGVKHHLLCSELKQLYVAVSRTRQRLWIYENKEDICNPMFEYWQKKSLIQVRRLHDSLLEEMKASSSLEEWKSRGMKLYHQHNYEMATMCFQNERDEYWERRAEAGGLRVTAYCMKTSNPEKARPILRKAAQLYMDIGMESSAARCFFDSEDYERAGWIYYHQCGQQAMERAAECFFLAKLYERAAGIFLSIDKAESSAECFHLLGENERAARLYEECGRLERAGDCFYLAGCYELAAHTYDRGKFFFKCLEACLEGKLFDIGLEYIKCWNRHSREEYDLAVGGNYKFLEICAFHYYGEVEDTRSKMKLVRSEMLSCKKILNSHLSSSCSKFLWDDKMIRDFCDLEKYSKVKQSEKQFSIDSLVYFWNIWKDKVVYLIEYFESLETSDVNEKTNYGSFILNYLGVWRQFHNDLNSFYTLLISDVDWVRGMNKRYFESNGELVTIDVCHMISTAHSYWTSTFDSFSIKVLNKLEGLYKFKSDSVFCQSSSLIQIYEVSKFLLESKYVKSWRKAQNFLNLSTEAQNFLNLSTENIVACIFPFDWRKSLRENMISLRQKEASKNLLAHVVVDYVSSSNILSHGKVGRLAMIILGSGNFDDPICDKLKRNLKCSTLWKVFFQNLCGNVVGNQKGFELTNNCQVSKDVSLVWHFHQALFKTYHVNWREVNDYISPDVFLYLIERLLMWVSCFQGYAITTKSCLVEWLMHKESAELTSRIRADVLVSFDPVLKFVIDVVREFLYNKKTMTEWIERSISRSENIADAVIKEYYSLLILRSVILLCMLYLNFGMGYDILLDLLWREDITEQLPSEFCHELRRMMYTQIYQSMNVDVLAKALKKIGDELVVASFGIDCSRFHCSDAIFVDMKADICSHERYKKLFHIQYSQGQCGAILGEAGSLMPSAYDSDDARAESFELHPSNSGLKKDEVQNTGNIDEIKFPMDLDGLWEKFESQSCLLQDASSVKLYVGKIIFLLTPVWWESFQNAVDRREELYGDVLSMLGELMQLYAALHGSEELVNKLSVRLQARRHAMERMFFWPDKMQLMYAKLFSEHVKQNGGNALEDVVESGDGTAAELGTTSSYHQQNDAATGSLEDKLIS